ncbi:DUF4229 domain-containing protein [Canibacter sp. lx-72]|uniref:DUF4229 domain-containing protein n=1 Tax=Canibacter zhuwentaonis TaxID=2837491 RepID=UPI001BDD937C|nr:DUF4229 domain-containing protein [Canibacter zhuwentaonis]MBT1018625.1 DUF4229 domain-containing protein [Canibacter zhuwentaonis]MBT1035865.1 DUF4229 domain-containing protein [Canibacter zhuwentaonis]
MSAKKAWLLYTFYRLLFFAVPLALILLLLPRHMLVGLNWGIFFAVACSALISLSLSVLFLSKLRHRAAAGIAEWRSNSHTTDSGFEDSVMEQDEFQQNQGN